MSQQLCSKFGRNCTNHVPRRGLGAKHRAEPGKTVQFLTRRLSGSIYGNCVEPQLSTKNCFRNLHLLPTSLSLMRTQTNLFNQPVQGIPPLNGNAQGMWVNNIPNTQGGVNQMGGYTVHYAQGGVPGVGQGQHVYTFLPPMQTMPNPIVDGNNC